MTEKEISARVDFLSSVKCNHTPHKYIDITGDLIQGTLLARIMYWFTEDKNKQRRVRIFKDGYFWIAKQRKDWWEEIRISERQYDKAIKDLEKNGFVVLAKYKFDSMPTIHIRPNYDNINDAVKKWEDELRKEITKENDEELRECENGNNTKCNSQGNDTKCKTGITQKGNLLTGITNSDYSNKDYNTDTTDKYAFSDKSSKVDMYASVSGKQEAEQKPQKNRYIPKDYTEEQLKEHIKPVIDNYIDQNCDKPNKDELKNNLLEIIAEFHREYEKKFAEKHRILADVSYENIAERYLKPPSIMNGNYDTDAYSAMIEQYFIVEFNKRKKYNKPIEISLSHFMSDEIRGHLYWQTCV